MKSNIKFSRPNDTTAYGSYENVNTTGSSTPFWLPVSNNDKVQRVLLKNLIFKTNMTTVPSGMTSFRLQFFNEFPNVSFSDNAAIPNLLTAIDGYMGYIDTPNLAALWGHTIAWKNSIEMVFDVASERPNSNSYPGIWVGISTNSAFTPVASTNFRLDFGFIGVE